MRNRYFSWKRTFKIGPRKWDCVCFKNIIKQMRVDQHGSIWDLENWRTCTRSNEIAVFLKIRYCYLWSPCRSPIFIKHAGFKYAVKHVEFQQFGTFGPSIFSDIVNISHDQRHFLILQSNQIGAASARGWLVPSGGPSAASVSILSFFEFF